MRSQLNETRLIDQYLFRLLSEAEARAFEAGLLLNEALAEKVEAQRTAHRLIRLYARKKEINRIDEIHRQLLDEPAFAQQVKTIFA